MIRNDIKSMLYKCTFLIVFVFCLISCNKTSKTVIDSEKIQGTGTQEASVNFDAAYRKGKINAECEYYHYDEPVGRLKQGQNILILNRYEPFGFDTTVEVTTADGLITGFVREKFITYDDELYTAWFKNVLLTREYYYTESPEIIANREGNTPDGADADISKRKGLLQTWRHFYSEERLRISERYFVVGNDDITIPYRIESVSKDDNTYILYLIDNFDGEVDYEVTFVDNGDSIIIAQYVIRNKTNRDIFPYLLNIKYVPYDSEKSQKTKKAVFAWIDEQLEILAKTKQ